MPVRRFRSVQEAAECLWREPGDPGIWQGLVRRWQLHRFFARTPRPPARPGVFKYRSLEEKQRAV